LISSGKAESTGLSIAAHNNLRLAKNLIVSDDIKVRKPGIEEALRFEAGMEFHRTKDREEPEKHSAPCLDYSLASQS